MSSTLGQETQYLTLECISPFPYTIPSPISAFSPSNRPMKPSDFITIVLSDFWPAGLIWDLVFENQTGGKIIHFFQKHFALL